MKHSWVPGTMLFALMLTCSVALADQINLKNGHEYTGKFIRGDANVVEFRILGRVETFKTSEVAQIIFTEPELIKPPSGRTSSSAPNPDTPAPAATAPVGSPPPSPDRRSEPAARQGSQESTHGATVTLPAGTDLTIRMIDGVDTEKNQVGDSFQASLQEPLSVGSQVVVPRGANVRGTIAYSKESGRATGKSELILELTELSFDGKSYPLRTSDYQEVGASRGARTAKAAGGTAALGAIIGAIAGGGKGAAIGAATGGAVGTGVAVMSKGQTIKVPAETLLDFKLQKPLSIDVP